ncbi:MAG: M48 family metallopeptidase [Deltaproteobacteria bacterium]|jgi:STE24 endopeptidase|nr:M48 family metallopeptidase [Deltaproteobacteria bacterium]MBW2480115.1 M48 family metallopeptidase [Deltaproteobacteria bacterium]
MNIIALIILLALLADFLLNGLADYLNLTRLRDELPAGFEGVYDPDRYRQSQAYLRANTRFGWITAAFDLIILLAFWFGKGFPLLDQWVRSFNYGPVVCGLIYMATLMLFKATLSLPFSLYHTFVIEERFGFNQTTWSTYILDRLKGLLLAVLLGAPLLGAVLAFFEYAGANAWWLCWAAVTLYMLGVQFIAPTWIMPLFNKFTPLETGELKSAILSYADSIKFPIENVYVMDGSKRSRKSNAFFTGFGAHRRIVLFDTLIKQHTTGELVAILAHEMGHYKKRHIIESLIFGILQMGLMLYLLSLFISYPGLFEAFYMSQPSVYAGLIFFAMLYSPLGFFVGLFLQKRSRTNETAADRFSVETTRDPQSMVDALKKLSVHNLSNLLPHPFYVFLNYSHPPVLQRIEAINAAGSR